MKRYKGYYTACPVCKAPIDWDEATCKQCHPEWLKSLQDDDPVISSDFSRKVGIVVICVITLIAFGSNNQHTGNSSTEGFIKVHMTE